MDELVKMITRSGVRGVRPRGRPQIGWMDSVKRVLDIRRMSMALFLILPNTFRFLANSVSCRCDGVHRQPAPHWMSLPLAAATPSPPSLHSHHHHHRYTATTTTTTTQPPPLHSHHHCQLPPHHQCTPI